jgi:hypothetical protein
MISQYVTSTSHNGKQHESAPPTARIDFWVQVGGGGGRTPEDSNSNASMWSHMSVAVDTTGSVGVSPSACRAGGNCARRTEASSAPTSISAGSRISSPARGRKSKDGWRGWRVGYSTMIGPARSGCGESVVGVGVQVVVVVEVSGGDGDE